MANFDLSQYQTVQERIDLFWQRYPDGRFNLDIISATEQQVIIKAEVWTDWAEDNPRAVDYAEERFGSSPVNKTSFIENCASSALGRAISQLGGNLSPKGKRPSATEMAKVNRINAEQTPAVDWLAMASGRNVEGLRELYSQAVAGRASKTILDQLKEMGVNKTAKSEPEGTW